MSRLSTSYPWRTCSSAVKTRAVQICFTLICLVAAAAMQELLPAFGGAKTPMLAVFAVYTAFRPSRNWILVAVAAGALEDALNGNTSLFSRRRVRTSPVRLNTECRRRQLAQSPR